MVSGWGGYHLKLNLATYAGRLLEKVLTPFQRAFPGLLKMNALIIGTPVSAGLTTISSPEASFETLSAVIERLKSYAQEQKIQVLLVRDFNQEKIPLEYALETAGFECMPNFPLAYMQVHWKNFDAYLADMKSRYRYDARRRMKRKTEQRIDTIFCKGNEAIQFNSQYVKLYRNVLARSDEYPHEYIGEDYHQAMAAHFGDRSYWLNYFQGEQLVAFLHFIQHREQLIAQYVGLDYKVSEAGQLYFNAFYDLIHFAIQQGLTHIESGIMSYPAKTSLGFSIRPQRMYLWHRRKLIRILINWIFSTLSQSNFDQCHIIFKHPDLQSLRLIDNVYLYHPIRIIKAS
jgi:predicted N-acyltransferase